ncbi:class I SAM-dependent methyltransferase [Saccharopolyspora sp. NPDC003752]
MQFKFSWTHLPSHVDERLLRLQPGQQIVDLGCGRGTHLAYLCQAYQVHGIGVDRDQELVASAHHHFQGDTAQFVQDEARAWLQRDSAAVDAIYSRFGAIWFPVKSAC